MEVRISLKISFFILFLVPSTFLHTLSNIYKIHFTLSSSRWFWTISYGSWTVYWLCLWNETVFRQGIFHFLVQLPICVCNTVGVTALATEYSQGFALYLRSSGQLSRYCTQNETRVRLVSHHSLRMSLVASPFRRRLIMYIIQRR